MKPETRNFNFFESFFFDTTSFTMEAFPLISSLWGGEIGNDFTTVNSVIHQQSYSSFPSLLQSHFFGPSQQFAFLDTRASSDIFRVIPRQHLFSFGSSFCTTAQVRSSVSVSFTSVLSLAGAVPLSFPINAAASPLSCLSLPLFSVSSFANAMTPLTFSWLYQLWKTQIEPFSLLVVPTTACSDGEVSMDESSTSDLTETQQTQEFTPPAPAEQSQESPPQQQSTTSLMRALQTNVASTPRPVNAPRTPSTETHPVATLTWITPPAKRKKPPPSTATTAPVISPVVTHPMQMENLTPPITLVDISTHTFSFEIVQPSRPTEQQALESFSTLGEILTHDGHYCRFAPLHFEAHAPNASGKVLSYTQLHQAAPQLDYVRIYQRRSSGNHSAFHVVGRFYTTWPSQLAIRRRVESALASFRVRGPYHLRFPPFEAPSDFPYTSSIPVNRFLPLGWLYLSTSQTPRLELAQDLKLRILQTHPSFEWFQEFLFVDIAPVVPNLSVSQYQDIAPSDILQTYALWIKVHPELVMILSDELRSMFTTMFINRPLGRPMHLIPSYYTETAFNETWNLLLPTQYEFWNDSRRFRMLTPVDPYELFTCSSSGITKTAREWALSMRTQDGQPIYTAFDRDPQRIWLPSGILSLHPGAPEIFKSLPFEIRLAAELGASLQQANPTRPTTPPHPFPASRPTQLADRQYARVISKSITSTLHLHRSYYTTFDRLLSSIPNNTLPLSSFVEDQANDGQDD